MKTETGCIMKSKETTKHMAVISEQELGDKSAKAMDVLSLAISKGVLNERTNLAH